MRRVLLSDILVASDVLVTFPKESWPRIVSTMFIQSEAAYRYFKRFARPHKTWGDGSLASWSGLVLLCANRDLNSNLQLQAFSILTGALAEFRTEKGGAAPPRAAGGVCRTK
jgi:hypothetical protein